MFKLKGCCDSQFVTKTCRVLPCILINHSLWISQSFVSHRCQRNARSYWLSLSCHVALRCFWCLCHNFCTWPMQRSSYWLPHHVALVQIRHFLAPWPTLLSWQVQSKTRTVTGCLVTNCRCGHTITGRRYLLTCPTLHYVYWQLMSNHVVHPSLRLPLPIRR